MPASVCTFRNSQRGLTRKVSSLVIFIADRGETGASFALGDGRCPTEAGNARGDRGAAVGLFGFDFGESVPWPLALKRRSLAA